MAHVEKHRRTRPGKPDLITWRARYVAPDGRERSRTFPRRVDAERFVATTEAAKIRGEWLDPTLARTTVGEWAQRWRTAQVHLKPATLASYDSLLRRHLLPRWGTLPLADVHHADVAGWVADLRAGGLSASRTRHAHRVLSLLLDLAVRDGRLPRNAAHGVELPRLPRSSRRYLTHDQLGQLADAGGRYRTLVLLLGYTGLRWGEAAALRVKRVDLLRGRLDVAESVAEVNGTAIFGEPKTHQVRSVPVPRFLRDDLAAACAGKAPQDLVFTAPEGGLLRLTNFRRRCFDRAVARVGLDPLVPHELRHTAASLAIAAGATVKGVQGMLGHSSATLTLDTYAGLFPDDLDAVADRLDAAATAARAAAETDPRRTRSSIGDLSQWRASR